MNMIARICKLKYFLIMQWKIWFSNQKIKSVRKCWWKSKFVLWFLIRNETFETENEYFLMGKSNILGLQLNLWNGDWNLLGKIKHKKQPQCNEMKSTTRM